MRDQVEYIRALVENAVVQFSSDAGRATEASADTKVMAVIGTDVSRSDASDYQNSAFLLQTAAERAVQKCLAKLHVVNDLATRTIDLPAFSVSVPKFVKNDV